MPTRTNPQSRPQRAALFVDYDNVYTVLHAQDTERAPHALAMRIIDKVRRYLEEGDDTPTVFARAYADFATLPNAEPGEAESELYEQGFAPQTTPTAVQLNASEQHLTADVIHLLHERPDITSIVIVTGDRPYLPLARAIRERGVRPLVAAVHPPQGDAIGPYLEEETYLDARNMLGSTTRDALNSRERANRPSRRRTRDSAPPAQQEPIDDPILRATIEVTEEFFGQYDEVYLTPLLRKISEELGEGYDPKALVSDLEAAGAVWLEKRDGYPYDYTVLIVNEEHEDVQKILDDYYRERTFGGYSNGTPAEEASADPDDSEAPYGPVQPSSLDEYAEDEYEEDAYDDDLDADPEPDLEDDRAEESDPYA
ncbi:NYN domain-containing protein [Longimonas halophila]|uniref:NYN domain-containing protein n=1 Tax=Longimonas halophila TaxID=1469170 RepID=A0A2H3NU07_9BACT|nr:NYN domain-containing protein [Longimonas halophila]PEN04956.1 NYN domain-containing protein [Longimonas halophila]